MGYRLRVPAEIGDWLVDLRESQPAVATEVGASLAALMAAELVPCPPLTLPAGADEEPSGDADPRKLVNRAYGDMLGDLQAIRRHVAHAATTQKRAELRVAELAGQADTDPDELAAATRQEAAARGRAQQLAAIAQRAQAGVDRFRTRKEVAKATYTAAIAVAAVRQSLAELGEESGIAESCAAQRAVDEAGQRVEDLLADARSLKRSIRDCFFADGGGGAARSARERPAPSEAANLMQLRSDPLGADIRILFALDPPGTATLLTVLEGPDAIAEYWEEASTAAGMLLEVIRDAGWPPYAGEPDGGGQEFDDAAAFLTEYFAADRDRIAVRAVQLAERATLDVSANVGGEQPRLS